MTDSDKTKMEKIHDYWEHAAKQDLDSDGLRATARDPYLQEVIEKIIEKRLNPESSLLDVGCGDGISTLRFARNVKKAVGVDYIESFVQRAKENKESSSCRNTEFKQGNVLDLSQIRESFGQFDIAISIRCLINLDSAKLQFQGLEEIAKCIRPGGLYLTSEGWSEGMEGLNLYRQRAGFEPIEAVDYNLMLMRSEFEKEAAKHFDLVSYQSLGFYLFMSRVFQLRFTAPEPPNHKHPINRVASELQELSEFSGAFNECDYAGVYVFQRR